MGRLPQWSEEEREIIIAHVCGQLAKGVPLTIICSDPDMPDVTTVFAWTNENDSFGQAVARARSAGFDAIALRTRETARGRKTEEGGDSSGDVKRDDLIIKTDLKLLSYWDRSRYGDAVQLRHADAEGNKLDTSPLIAELMTLVRGAQKPQETLEGSARLIGTGDNEKAA